VGNNKKEIRQNILNKRKKVNTLDKKKWNTLIYNKVINFKYYINSKKIFTFVSYNNEVDTYRLINYSIKNNKKVYVPKINNIKDKMEVYEINTFSDLEIGKYGILEPKRNCKKIEKPDMELVIVPGIAFDYDGNRIGYGKGYYDKFFKENNTNFKKVALAYDFQILKKIPHNVNDVKVNYIISNKQILNF